MESWIYKCCAYAISDSSRRKLALVYRYITKFTMKSSNTIRQFIVFVRQVVLVRWGKLLSHIHKF
jgi:hypothetical protein